MRKVFCIAIIAASFLGVMVARADVVIKHKASTEMGGMVSTEMQGSDTYKSDRCYNETTTKMTGGMMTMLGKGKPTQSVEITRLDKGLIWKLESDKKKYSEEAIESYKKKFADAQEDADGKEEEPEYTWTMEITPIAEPQTINGFNCKGVIGKSTGVKKDNPTDSLFITYEQWMTKDVAGSAEVQEYQKNYAKAMGVDEMFAEESMATVLGQYGGQFAELATKINEAGNYPIKTIITVETPSRPESSDESGGGGDMMSQMSKMFGKNESEKAEVDKSGRSKSFFMSNEILSVEQKPVGDAQFEIPADYKKQ